MLRLRPLENKPLEVKAYEEAKKAMQLYRKREITLERFIKAWQLLQDTYWDTQYTDTTLDKKSDRLLQKMNRTLKHI